MGQEISILKEAREIVRTRPMDLRVGHLKSCADELHEAYDVLRVSCTRTSAMEFTAMFTRTVLAIEQVHASAPLPPCGGKMEQPELRTGTA